MFIFYIPSTLHSGHTIPLHKNWILSCIWQCRKVCVSCAYIHGRRNHHLRGTASRISSVSRHTSIGIVHFLNVIVTIIWDLLPLSLNIIVLVIVSFKYFNFVRSSTVLPPVFMIRRPKNMYPYSALRLCDLERYLSSDNLIFMPFHSFFSRFLSVTLPTVKFLQNFWDSFFFSLLVESARWKTFTHFYCFCPLDFSGFFFLRPAAHVAIFYSQSRLLFTQTFRTFSSFHDHPHVFDEGDIYVGLQHDTLWKASTFKVESSLLPSMLSVCHKEKSVQKC